MRSLETLLDSIVEATNRSKIVWSTEDGRRFDAALQKYTVKVWHWTDPHSDVNGVTVQLVDQHGNVIDAVSADEYSPKYNNLENLFGVARRSANKIDEILDEIESELSSLAPATSRRM